MAVKRCEKRIESLIVRLREACESWGYETITNHVDLSTSGFRIIYDRLKNTKPIKKGRKRRLTDNRTNGLIARKSKKNTKITDGNSGEAQPERYQSANGAASTILTISRDMSLYDDIEVPEDAREKALQSSSVATEAAKKADLQARSMNLSFLKSQLEAKKAMQSSQKNLNVSSPVVDFGGSRAQQQKPVRSLLNLKPRKAVPLAPIDSTSSFSIVPKALTEDKVFLFGEFNVEDEYNPTAPTDYASFKTKREAQKIKEKIAKDIADRILKQHEEEESKRKSGACFAPPQNLIEQDSIPTSVPSPPTVYESPSQFGKKSATRGLGVAANIMKSMGYREGFGLGREEQGMSTALRVEKTGKTGVIIAETVTLQDEGNDIMDVGTGFSVRTEKTAAGGANITELLKNASKIVLLKNMVLPSEVDSDLEGEIREEMKKYGQLNDVIVHTMPNAPTDEAVRIFLEFTNVNHAIKSVVDLNGRFFGGRAIRPEFYSLDKYTNRMLDE